MPITEHKASDYLKTPEDIVAYLNAAIDEMEDDPRLLMKAFRNVAEAQGGISALARHAQLDRVALSRALSGQRNPAPRHTCKGISRLWCQASVLGVKHGT